LNRSTYCSGYPKCAIDRFGSIPSLRCTVQAVAGVRLEPLDNQLRSDARVQNDAARRKSDWTSSLKTVRPDDFVRRRSAHAFGLRAETIAALLLRLKGYSILERRYAVMGGEIDLIAKRGRSIAFVEVKARGGLDAAAEAIGARKQRRIARAVRVWLTRNPWAASLTLRGDAVLVARGRLPRHMASAYTLDID